MKEASLMGGSTKSSARSAPGEDKTGNLGKAIGDKGKKCPNGNPKTRGAADRYK
jgi:hypothetical protein